MANLYGTGPNQVPLNSMLGNLAFQDKAYVSVDKVGIGTTFVDSGTEGQILQVYGGGAYVSGSVGIGTTNPSDTLDVVGTVRPRLGIRDSYGNVGTAGSILVSTGAGVSWTSAAGAGAAGPQGVQGAQGNQGAQGTQGTQGLQGPAGTVQGAQGSQGTQGLQGSGTQGIQGTQGVQGSGIQGIQGLAGSSQGTQGAQGLQGSGIQGIQGSQGTQGVQGLSGYSAANIGKIFYYDYTSTSDVSGAYVALENPSADATSTQIVSTTGTLGVGTYFTPTNVPSITSLPAGSGTHTIYANTGASNEVATLTVEIYKSNSTGGTLTLLSSATSGTFSGTNNTAISWNYTLSSATNFDITDRLAFKIYVNRSSGPASISVTLKYEGTSTQSNVLTPIAVGNPGPQGTQGTQGIQGSQGSQGRQGTQGASVQGVQGPAGSVQGSQGTQGVQGTQGNQGVGTQGLQGEQGTQGNQGASVQGVQGPSGGGGGGGSINVVDNTTTNETYYIGYSTISGGTLSNLGISSTKLQFNPSTGALGIGTVIDIIPYDTLNTLSWEGSAGQLFSITNNLTSGSIFSVNDASGIPSIDVDANGTIQLAPYGVNEKVGIGTTNPTQKLDVNGTIRLRGSLQDVYGNVGTAGSVLISSGSGVVWSTGGGGSQGTQGVQGTQGNQGASVQGVQGIQGTQGNQGASVQGVQGPSGGGGGGGSINVVDNTTTNETYYVGYSTISGGTLSNLGISSTKLQFNPSTGTLFATIFTSLSDRTQKENIRPIENALNIVNNMNGVYYDWVDGHNQSSVGLIAQEVEKVLPQVISTNDDGLKTISYGNIVAVLIEAIKEQQIRIERLEDRLNA